MLISVILANLLILVEQCQSQVLRNDRQYSVQYEPQTYTQESEFLQASRPKANQYQYQYELAQNYQPEAIYQQSYAPSSVTSTRVSRPKQEKNQPVVEQYLKEVTPTTKTVYEPIPYQYSNQVPILKQAQYVLEQEPQQRTYVPQPKYEIPEAATASPVAQNTLAYHNVLLAHQNAIYDKQRTPNQPQKPSQGPPPKSAIFITQSIPKKPKVVKIVKPKTSTLDEEIDYLTKLQYRQQQLQQQSKDNEANQFKYQSRIPQYAKPELLTAEEEQAQIHQPRIASPLLLAKPIKVQRLPSYQPQYQQSITYQPEIAYQHQPQQYEQPQLIQYQPQPQEQLQNTYKAGPRYLPDQKQVRYQEVAIEKYQQSEIPREAIQKYQIPVNPKIARPQQIQYTLEDQSQQREQPQQYKQVQQQTESSSKPPPYQGPTDDEYKESEVKQKLGRNSNLRILKTGKPVVFIGHEE